MARKIKGFLRKIKGYEKRIINPPVQEESPEKLEEKRQQEELREVQNAFADKAQDYVWAFIAGQYSQDFRGNPKYLFVYINKYRPDIATYWLTSTEETIQQVRSLGYRALKLEEPAAQYAINHTGVLVVEQVKIVIPQGFENVKYLNLWHGVGFKHIERKLFLGDIAMGLAQKYISHNAFYRDHQLMTVTSPMIEKEFMADCGLDEDKLIRSGYLRCLYQQNFEPIATFEHDLRKVKGLPENTKLVVYAPTYRAQLGGTFSRAMVDIEKLYQCCETNNILLIFKVHPNMEKETGFLRAWETYGARKHFWFWDNQYDFYEIMDQMDLAIVDYSAIFSDMVAVGIRHYIRYIFDYEEYMQDGFTQNEYFERTLGTVCRTFDELLDTLSHYEETDDSEEFDRINETFWSYSGGKDDFEKVIQQTMDFKIVDRTFPTLYSFDVFDTLFSRKVLDPTGIFYYVKEKMEEAGDFPKALTLNYPSVRHSSEFNVREYYQKTQDSRNSDHIEIAFDEIFNRMAVVYDLTDDQVTKLKDWELEAELDNVIPLPKQINLVKRYLETDNKVVFISDMYLPKDFVVKMLQKADPVLASVPLFLSSEYGVQKTTQKLYFEVYKSFEPFYDFGKWIHYGDNIIADQLQPRRLGIYTRLIIKPEFNDIQQQMVDKLKTYDSYLVAALQTRLYQNAVFERDEFVCSYVTLCMVPYVDWAIRDAVRRGYQTLYFISRDGHPLKKIADAIIKQRKLDLKTKYIYASRRAWRTPSYIHEVDEAFWQPYGNFSNITSKEKLFRAMELDEETFTRMFPSINPDTIDFINKDEFQNLLEIFKASKTYREYLLDRAAKERVLVSGYLKQEIDPTERIAFIEYWGRGYTQDCMVRLWQDIVGEEVDVPFYYSRSIEPTSGGAVRHNFITNDASQLFVESFFANMPYKSVEKYEVKDGKIVPVIVPISYNVSLFDSMERMLPEFARQYAALELHNPEDTDRLLYEFALDYYQENRTNEKFAESIGSLVDSVALYGKKREYAPPYTMEDLDRLQEKEVFRGSAVLTTSISMSYIRSEKSVKDRYRDMYQIFPEDDVAGNFLLTEEQQKENAMYRDMYKELLNLATEFRNLYEEAVEQYPIDPASVLLVVNGKTLKDDSALGWVQENLQKNEGFHIHTLCAGASANVIGTEISLKEKARMVAEARYIIAVTSVHLFCKTKFRSETEEILLCLTPFHLYNQGLMTDYRLKWREKYMNLAAHNDVSVLQIPSRNVEELYRKSYAPNSDVKCSLLGCCITDQYYDTDYINKSKQKLREVFPESEGKKVILYVPFVKVRQDCTEWMDLLDLDVLHRLLGEQYVVAVNINKKQLNGIKYKNQFAIPGFSKWIRRGISIQNLLAACDVVVGDYRDIFFQAALLHKPVYSTAYDYERQFTKSPNLRVARENYDQLVFCPVVNSSAELAAELEKADSYDYDRLKEFAGRWMDGCDGKSIERVVNYIEDGIRQTVED